MKVIVTEDYATLSRAAAEWVAVAVTEKPNAVAAFPTGSSPLGLFAELSERHRQGLFDASQLRIFLLDEYMGIADDDPRSLYSWLQQSLFAPLAIGDEQIARLPTQTGDPEAACRAYEQSLIAAGGLDFLVLGLGPNGHIGYNDPPSAGHDPTRIVTLTPESIAGAAKDFGGIENVPPTAMALGMVPLLAARQILLIVSGERKREILDRTLNGPITPDVPASYLRQAVNVTVLADRAALPEG